jgi:acetylornithine aminotransferase
LYGKRYNGFPIGGILIAPHFEASYGFVRNYFEEVICLCAVLLFRHIESQNLMEMLKNSIFHGSIKVIPET